MSVGSGRRAAVPGILSKLRADRRGATGGLNGGSSQDLHAGESGGLRRQVSGFEPEAQQQLGGDEPHTRE